MFARKRKDQPVGWSFLLKGEGLKERFASEATFSGLAQVFVDHVACVHAGTKGDADGRAGVVIVRHAVRAALVDACAAYLFQARGPPETRAARFGGGEADRAIAKVQENGAKTRGKAGGLGKNRARFQC